KSGTHVGTGFLVAENALATNRHVLGALTFGSEVLVPAAGRVVFRQEYGGTNKPGEIVSIDGVLAMHPRLDMVLLAVGRPDGPVLEIAGGGMNEGGEVARSG